MQFSVGNNIRSGPTKRIQQTGRQPNQKSINQRTIQDKMLKKAQQGNFTQFGELKNSLYSETEFKNTPESKMKQVFKLGPNSTPSTETGEMSLKCFFLEQSLESRSTTKEECIATCNALFDYVTNFETQGVFDGTMLGSALNLVGATIPQSSGRLNNLPEDLATKMHYFEDLLQRCDDKYPGAMEAVMTSKGMGYTEPASRPQQSSAIPTAGQSMVDSSARAQLNISNEYREKNKSEQANVKAEFAAKYKSEQKKLKNDYHPDKLHIDIEAEFDLNLEIFNKDSDPDDESENKYNLEQNQASNISGRESPRGIDEIEDLEQKFASAQHQENNISGRESSRGVDGVSKATMDRDNAQQLIQTIFDEIVTNPVFKNRSSFQAVMDAFRKGTVFTNNNNGKRGKNETCGTNYLNKNHKQKIIDISNGTSKQSEGVQQICKLFKNHAQKLEQLIDSQNDLRGKDIYYKTSTLQKNLSWVESSFVKNEIQVTTDSFILMAKVMINHESLEGSAAGNFAHRLSELVR